jgi:hypothetical protein
MDLVRQAHNLESWREWIRNQIYAEAFTSKSVILEMFSFHLFYTGHSIDPAKILAILVKCKDSWDFQENQFLVTAKHD